MFFELIYEHEETMRQMLKELSKSSFFNHAKRSIVQYRNALSDLLRGDKLPPRPAVKKRTTW